MPSDGTAQPLAHRLTLLACMALAVLHQLTHWDWYIEDAAICFAYARNIVNGEGAVPYPGGERVEAFSNPTWTALLTLFHALGVDGWTSSKWMALGLGPLAVWVSWRLAREALPEHAGPGALIAPILVAVSSQFAIWSASGLETSLFAALLGLALWRLAVELRSGGAPWSALWFFLLAWTRPEGAIYVAVGAAWRIAVAVRARSGWRALAVWAAAIAAPSAVLEAGRIAYFAWPLPNTYYAKVGDPVAEANVQAYSVLSAWSGRGWLQLRDWAERLWLAWWVPVGAIGVAGRRGWRARVALGVVAVLALSLLWPGPDVVRALPGWPDLPRPPGWFVQGRAMALVVAGAALPLLAWGARGGVARGLAGHGLAAGLFFALASDGDWMHGYRWMSLFTVPLAVVLAVGLVEAIEAIQALSPRPGPWRPETWLVAATALGLTLPPNASMTRDHMYANVDPTPTEVKKRVDYLRGIAARAHWDGELSHLEVDQGGFLWFAPDFRMVDYGELIDVPLSRHGWASARFVHEYVFEERAPLFVNMTRGFWWHQHTGIPDDPDFVAEYIPLAGYRTRFGTIWAGLRARRDLVMTDRWDAPVDRRVGLDGGWVIEGLDVPVAWEAGARGYLELPLSTTVPRDRTERLTEIVFLADGDRVVASWTLKAGYGLLSTRNWLPGEVFRGRHAVAVPADLPPGTYDLGVVLLDAVGRVFAPAHLPPEVAADRPPVYAAGEVRFPGVVRVVSTADVDRLRAEALDASASEAGAGRCEEAEAAVMRYLRLRPEAHMENIVNRYQAGGPIATCWALRAEGSPDQAAALLATAHRWDHRNAALERVGAVVAERLIAEADAAGDAADWERAYRLYTQVLGFAPWRAWVRRSAERARRHRLDLPDRKIARERVLDAPRAVPGPGAEGAP